MRRLLTASLAAGVLSLVAATPAAASYSWCDSDPPVAIVTPQGHLVVVYDDIFANGLTNLTYVDLSTITYTTKSLGNGQTAVRMYVTAPNGLLGGYATKVNVNSAALSLGTFYGSAQGYSGAPMEVDFTLNTP